MPTVKRKAVFIVAGESIILLALMRVDVPEHERNTAPCLDLIVPFLNFEARDRRIIPGRPVRT